jgi:hypothetical protein
VGFVGKGQRRTIALAATGVIQAQPLDADATFERNGELRVILSEAGNLFGKQGRAILDLKVFMTGYALFVGDPCQLFPAFVLDVTGNTGRGNGLCDVVERAVVTFKA